MSCIRPLLASRPDRLATLFHQLLCESGMCYRLAPTAGVRPSQETVVVLRRHNRFIHPICTKIMTGNLT